MTGFDLSTKEGRKEYNRLYHEYNKEICNYEMYLYREKKKEKLKQYAKEYRDRTKDKKKEYNKKYYAEHKCIVVKENIPKDINELLTAKRRKRAYNCKYHDAHRDEKREYNKKYYWLHREKILKRRKELRIKHGKNNKTERDPE